MFVDMHKLFLIPKEVISMFLQRKGTINPIAWNTSQMMLKEVISMFL
jgi:hypothetical protein